MLGILFSVFGETLNGPLSVFPIRLVGLYSIELSFEISYSCIWVSVWPEKIGVLLNLDMAWTLNAYVKLKGPYLKPGDTSKFFIVLIWFNDSNSW